LGVKFSPLGNKKHNPVQQRIFVKKTAKLPDFEDLFIYIYIFFDIAIFQQKGPAGCQNISDFFNFSTFLSNL
jgi:hypothetical protein